MNRNNQVCILYSTILVIINLAVFFFIFPKNSFFIEDVNSGYLHFAKYSKLIYAPNFSSVYFWIVHHVFGENPFFFHFTNAIVHICNVLLVYILGSRLCKEDWVGFISALLFSVHYMNTQVLFITKRIDELLAVCFMLLSLLALHRFIFIRKKRYYILSLMLFWITPVFRYSTFTFPFLVFIYFVLFDFSERGLSFRFRQGIYKALPFSLSLIVLSLSFLNLSCFAKVQRIIFSGVGASAFVERIHCFFGNFAHKIMSLPTFYKFIFIPFDFQSPSSVSFANNEMHYFGLSLMILLFLVGLFFVIKKPEYRFVVSWLIFTPLPFLFQRFPCGAGFVKEKYLYLPLVGGCLLIGFLLKEISYRIQGNRWVKGRIRSGVLLTFLLTIPLMFSLYNRARYRRQVGAITKNAQNLVQKSLTSSTRPKLMYFFIPCLIFRYQTFTGGGNLLNAILSPHSKEKLNITQFITEVYPGEGKLGLNELYSSLGMVVEKNNIDISREDLNRVNQEEPIPGLDSLFPHRYERHVFYFNKRELEIKEITDYVYPESRIEFKVVVSRPVKSLFIRGDFNGWKKTPLRPEDGFWKVVLSLRPGLYKYYFVDNAGNRFLPSCEEYKKNALQRKVCLLPVINYNLPIGLSQNKGSEYYKEIIKYKRKIRLYPGKQVFHKKLGDLYEELGYDKIAGLELNLCK